MGESLLALGFLGGGEGEVGKFSEGDPGGRRGFRSGLGEEGVERFFRLFIILAEADLLPFRVV
jgi:hypothetical protein